LAALALIVAAPAGALAADMPDFLRGSYTPAYTNWEGLHFGGYIGASSMAANFGNATSNEVAYILRNTTLETEIAPSSWTALGSTTTNSMQYGGFVGYNWQWDQLVLGLDFGYTRLASMSPSASDAIARIVTTSDNVTHDVTIVAQSSAKLLDYATLRGRAGYGFGQFLPYAVVGVAVGRFNYANTATVTDVWTPSGGSATTFGPVTQSDAKDNAFAIGFATGLGMDVQLTPNLFLRGEWEYVAFTKVGGILTSINAARAGLGARF
jgi:opacity protein-like surface antigen